MNSDKADADSEDLNEKRILDASLTGDELISILSGVDKPGPSAKKLPVKNGGPSGKSKVMSKQYSYSQDMFNQESSSQSEAEDEGAQAPKEIPVDENSNSLPTRDEAEKPEETLRFVEKKANLSSDKVEEDDFEEKEPPAQGESSAIEDEGPNISSLYRRQYLLCKHSFHAHCIQEWLQVQATCPICRVSLKDAIADEMQNDSVNNG